MTELIIRHYHLLEGHSWCSQVLAAIRKRFWIVHGYAALNRVIGKCFSCKRLHAPVLQQVMVPIPAESLKRGWYSFKLVGADYFAPMLIKCGGRIEMRYGCIFTCLQTRAIHLKIAHSLSTDVFIMALMAFIARRGPPSHIYNGNGTNFTGVEAEIAAALKKLSHKGFNDRMLTYGV